MKLFYTYKDIMKILKFSKCKAYGIERDEKNVREN